MDLDRLRRTLASPAGLGRLGLGLWVAVLFLWWRAAVQHPWPVGVSRGVVVLAVLASLGWAAWRWGLALRGTAVEGPPPTADTAVGRYGRLSRGAALVLAGLLVLHLVVRFVGLGFEVEGRYYLDEGTYYHHATEINSGQVLRFSFVYPHLLYYLDALALWLAGLFPGVARAFAGLYGVSEPLSVSWLLLRGVVALLSAATVFPVFFLGRRLGGTWGGALAALLLAFQPLYNEGSHLNTCDVPSAFFAAICLALVTPLLERESAWGYVLAGIAAGLAAGSKYPAGLVAVAIIAVWVAGRIARRPWNWGLLWAGLAALATFVAVMPSLLAFPREALFGGRGMLFGARQYGEGGWLGVTPRSNLAFYASFLAESFGLPALIAGLAGLAVLVWRSRCERRLFLGLLPFPVLYLGLIASMSMVVKRNLYPALPPLGAFLGAGLAALAAFLASRWGERRMARLAFAALALGALGPAVAATWTQAAALASSSTREQAGEWIRAHLPPGAALVKESYTPDFAPGALEVRHVRFAGRIPVPEMRQGYDYLLLSSAAYARFLDPAALTRAHQQEIARRYQEIFATFTPVREWNPDERHQGPILRLFRIPLPLEAAAACPPAATLGAEKAFLPEDDMRVGPLWPIRYARSGQWARFALCLPAGSYEVQLDGTVVPPARVRAIDPENLKLGDLAVAAEGVTRPFTVPALGRVLLYVELAPGSRLKGLRVSARPPAAG